jgi:predicted double-glycine peptidase
MAQILIIIIACTIFLFGAEFRVESFQQMRYKDVIKQTYEESCGASALASLFNMYGIDTNETNLIKDLNSSNIVSFLNLQQVSAKNDFQAKGYKISKKIFQQLTIPVIARIIRRKNYPHFVVVQNIKGDFVLLLDPNSGKYLVTKKEFYGSWIGKKSNFILVVIPNKKLTLRDISYLDISKLDFVKDLGI